MVKKALLELLNNDATIEAAHARYRFTTGVDSAAIFISRIIPEDSSMPATIIGQAGGVDWGCRDKKGGDTLLDIRTYDAKYQDDTAISDISHNIWELVNRSSLDFSLLADGYHCVGCWAEPPAQLEDPDGFPGYLVRVRALIIQT